MKTLRLIAATEPTLFQNRDLGVSISLKARGFLMTNKYMTPGKVNDEKERPKAPTNSNTTVMLSTKIEPTIHPA